MKKPPLALPAPSFPTSQPPLPSPPFTLLLRRQRFCRYSPPLPRSSPAIALSLPVTNPLLPAVLSLPPPPPHQKKVVTTFWKLLTTFPQPLSSCQKLLSTFQKLLTTFLKPLTTSVQNDLFCMQRLRRCPQRSPYSLPAGSPSLSGRAGVGLSFG